MKKRHILLTILAVIFVLSSSIGTAIAYFTTFVTAKGGYVVHLGNQTKITENYSSGKKVLSVTNTGAEGKYPVFVRVRAFAGSDYELEAVDTTGKWILDRGFGQDTEGKYWYYKDELVGNATSEELTINITYKDKDKEWKDGAERNIIVVYESTPAVFTSSGDPDLETAWTIGKVTPFE